MIEDTLGPIRYIHDHFLRFAQLSLGFMTKCNNKGEFLVSEEVPEKGIFKESQEYLKMIKEHEECKENRNEKDWITSCISICKNFKMTYYTHILSGQWEYLFEYLQLFKDRHTAYLTAADGNNMINPDDIVSDDMESSRILAEQKSDFDKIKNNAEALNLISANFFATSSK